jgi:hypothetical protein
LLPGDFWTLSQSQRDRMWCLHQEEVEEAEEARRAVQSR